MNKHTQIAPPALQNGVVLLESLIAILIFSFGILGIVGLQAAMIKNTSDSRYRIEAGFITQQVIGTLWADPANLASYAGTVDISSLLPNGTRLIQIPAVGQVIITVSWQQPGGSVHQFVTSTDIVINN